MVSTLKQISQEAGTSVSTASLILNGNQAHRFSKQTRDAILAAADKLGYRPQRAAQSLVTGKTRNVALILNSLANPFFGAYASRLQSHLMEHGMTAIPFEVQSEEVEAKGTWLDWIDMRAVDAAIDLQGAMGIGPNSIETYERFTAHRPIIFRGVSESPLLAKYDRVIIDYDAGVRDLMHHLAEMGRKELGVVTVRGHVPKPGRSAKQPVGDYTSHRLIQLAEDAELHLPERRFRGAEIETADSIEWCRAAFELLRDHPEIDALIGHNLESSPAVLHGVEMAGRTVGTDLAFATFDDLPIAKWLGPGITVVGEPFEDVAAKLARMTLQKLGDRSAEPTHERAASRLIVRGSTDPTVTHEDAVLRRTT
ncbi:MAG: LacI family DNA-binding transcriptional regulator [Planctomycetota bacterium]